VGPCGKNTPEKKFEVGFYGSTALPVSILIEPCIGYTEAAVVPVPVSVEAKLSFAEPGHRRAHSSSPSKAPGISYQGTMKTSVRMLKTSEGL